VPTRQVTQQAGKAQRREHAGFVEDGGSGSSLSSQSAEPLAMVLGCAAPEAEPLGLVGGASSQEGRKIGSGNSGRPLPVFIFCIPIS
jgi:hypothetical protein